MTKALCFALALAAPLACGGSTPSPSTPTAPPSQSGTANCSVTSVNLTPLNDLLSGSYKGEPGGLYPGRTNARPGSHDAAGLALAKTIGPRDSAGNPDPEGRYAFVSIGMSNTTMEFSVFKSIADREPGKNAHLVIVDGAQGGQTASLWSNPSCSCWAVLDDRLRQAGLTAAQVAVVWIKEADANPTAGWPAYAQQLTVELEAMLQMLQQRFPSLALAYLSSRTYAGYASTALNPEPYAYESAFSVRGVIQDQLSGAPGLRYDSRDGAPSAPWVSWGPYLWANGTNPRSDGLTWTCADVRSNDGTHPSDSGSQKVAQLLLEFIRNDATARAWFYQ
jgi:hypothetical protein